MIKNYFIVALRNFWRNKVFTIINISGLSIGISAALIIYLVVHYEFKYDRFEKDGNRIYRVITDMHFPDQLFKNSGAPAPLAQAVRSDVPGLEVVVPFHLYSATVNIGITSADNKAGVFKNQEGIILADERYFNLLGYQWLAGSPALLKEPFKTVITESRAKAYFTNARSAIGKTISYNDSIKTTVVGVVKDLTEQTDFTFKEFVSFATIENSGIKNNLAWGQWGSLNSSSQLFVKLDKNANAVAIEKLVNAVAKKHGKESYLQMTHKLQPLNDIHFNSEYSGLGHGQAQKSTLYGLMLLAVFLLLLGCINFINLTTAQSIQRAKEIGIRKTMGGSKKQLMFQFLSETFLLIVAASILAVAMCPYLAKIFANYVTFEIQLNVLLQKNVLFFFTGLIIIMTLLSGFYPALVLSSYKPVLVLKNASFINTRQSRKAWLRKSLTVSQFVIAQFFIIAAILVSRQISYALNMDLGFRKDAIINFSTPAHFNKDDNRRFVLLQKLQAMPGIEMISLAGAPPASMNASMQTIKFNNGKREIETTVETKDADTNYFKLYHMKLLAGRNFQASDSTREYVINNTYAKFLGYQKPEELIGKLIPYGKRQVPIVGVLADFHNKSMHELIKPLVFSCNTENSFNFHVLLKQAGVHTGEQWKQTIDKIEVAFKKLYPEEDTFYHSFFDEDIARFYDDEQQTSSLLKWATALAIFISCLGLLGLVIYSTNTRTKEIGVRKVLGASVTQIVTLLSKDFVKLVMVAFVIAAPLSWWATYKWLQDYAYRTNISWWIFLVSGASMVLAALLTLSVQTIRSAMANPVKSLRTE